ncbi:MAG: DUF4191 domain-containing protein [Micromonosporaceae bacterium]|nr:DUF4191 domain-containing protein [Micromonosporaceae bacterium]
MAKAADEKVSFRNRLKQIGMVFSFTAKRDRLFVPLVAVALAVPLAAAIVLAVLGFGWIWVPAGVLLGVLLVLIILNMRANKAMMVEATGQPGAAAQLIETWRGDWRVTPAIASTTQFDMVHLVIGRPGVILLAEGSPARVRSLLGQEKRRISKVIGSVEMRDYVVGEGEGELPIAKLRSTLMRLPRTITGREVNALETRLKALTARPQMPKGAIPKNMRPPKGAFRAMRGR